VSDELSVAATTPVEWPSVSVIMPVLNEAAHLETAVRAVLAQEYPLPFQICLAVGPCSDDTEAIAAALAADDPRVKVVPNPTGRTPAGLNAALGASDGDVVVRVDGHAELSPGYIRRAVATLERTGAVNVGGVQAATGVTPFERAVAVAMMSRAGTGGARFHVGGQAGPVDTVYLGVFRRAAVQGVGGFDERLIRNQDYELNIRLREAGGLVWFDPDLWVSYRPRGTVRTLARQYRQYGQWKRAVVRLHPDSLKVRQVAPVVVTVAVGAGLVGALFNAWALVLPAGYVAAIGVAALAEGLRLSPRVALALATMHLSWGVGFLTARPRRMLAAMPGHG
jgi:glycosyltransferase involved in cell wall biosynthesis